MGTFSDYLPLAVRLLLSTMFLVSGAAKIVDLSGSLQAMRDFGAPRVVQPLGVALPPAELVVATGLLFTRTAAYAAWGAFALLVVFMAAIAVNLVRGRQPDCHCFGQLHVRPISKRTLVRTAILASAAAWLVFVGRRHPAVDLWTFLAGLDSRGRRIAMAVAGLIVFTVLSALVKHETTAEDIEPDSVESSPAPPRPPRARPAATVPPAAPAGDVAPTRVLTGMGLPVGTPAPAFVLPDLEGQPHSLEELRASGKPLVLVFSSPHCGACRTLGPKLPPLAARHASRLTMAVITRAGAQEHITSTGGVPLLLFQREGEVSEAYDCTSIPAAVLIGVDGVIRSPAAIGGPEIESLLASVEGPTGP